uniref:Formin-like protein 3 isoform X2 n=1 Tax=Petromyzon marinus TaxID=7757 RepID=A0AAJ7SXW7_PETMA|nr:formin-like protein 3 isoform X2 [Petromyzon marinus]
MGSASSAEVTVSGSGSPDTRSLHGTPPRRLPVPSPEDLEARFSAVLSSMNLPPDKAKALHQYEDEKKWELVCDQERFQVKSAPHACLAQLKVHLNAGLARKFKRRVQESTLVLREIEISLRTNHIGWLHEFLNEENRGLDVLVDYLHYAQCSGTYDTDGPDTWDSASSLERPRAGGGSSAEAESGAANAARQLTLRHSSMSRRRTSRARALTPVSQDDVHVCIMCLRAIMNYQYGFNMVMEHASCVNEVALSLNNRNPRTKALVLELLAAVCLVMGGHDKILAAFDNFKEVCAERYRFEKLMEYFRIDDTKVDFMVACMQFINIVVHSVEDMNFRVHLQYEFTHLGLDGYLERLKNTESERLQVQIQAYLDNVFDVGSLLEDADTKTAALERVGELEEQLGIARGRLRDTEDEALVRIVDLEQQLCRANEQLVASKELNREMSCRVVQLEQRLKETEAAPGPPAVRTKGAPDCRPASATQGPRPPASPTPASQDEPGAGVAAPSGRGRTPPAGGAAAPPEPSALGSCARESGPLPAHEQPAGEPPAEPPAGPPPPPPLPPPPPPPPPPPGAPPPPGTATEARAPRVKTAVVPRFRMPAFNWAALQLAQIHGTVFHELDDERVLQELNMSEFEDLFKTRAQGGPTRSPCRAAATRSPSRRLVVMDSHRAKNLAITLRRAGLPDGDVVTCIEKLHVGRLPLDFVESLTRLVPTEVEGRRLRQYEREGRPLGALPPEERFMLRLSAVARLPQRLAALAFMGNFSDSASRLLPQLNAVIAASLSLKSSQKLKKILEIVLAFGNYMNGSRRGAAYGFKLNSLDLLLDTKSTDRSRTLLQYLTRVVREHYPELSAFHAELQYLDKAASVSLDSVLLDVKELEDGMEATRREQEAAGEHAIIRDFLAQNSEMLRRLQRDAHAAQEAYSAVVEYYGEEPKSTPPSAFFPLFARFVCAYKQADAEDQARDKQDQSAGETRGAGRGARGTDDSGTGGGAPGTGTAHGNAVPKRAELELIAELKRRQQAKERIVYEGKDGAIEDIITDLRSQPYLRADAVRRSWRRKDEDGGGGAGGARVASSPEVVV